MATLTPKRERADWLANYKIFETAEYIASLSKITVRFRKKVDRKMDSYVYPQLREVPHYGLNIKKLHNYSPETWRYRSGDYRLFYSIDESRKIVNILSIDQRKDAY